MEHRRDHIKGGNGTLSIMTILGPKSCKLIMAAGGGGGGGGGR